MVEKTLLDLDEGIDNITDSVEVPQLSQNLKSLAQTKDEA